jgi:hypothetical protein
VNVNTAFPSQFLKASDLGANVATVTISHVTMEAVGHNKEQKPVVYFENKQKGVVLNRVNAKKITDIAGSAETEDWAGVRVALFATMTEFGGEQVECIRIKAPTVARAAQSRPVQVVRAVAKPAAEVPVELEPDTEGPDFDADCPF